MREELTSMTLQVYVLHDPHVEQAAWVRSNTACEAAMALCKKTDIPVVISNDYGWVPFPEDKQVDVQIERPLPRWEFSIAVRGPADLKSMPEHVRDLIQHVPRKIGGVRIGAAFPCTAPLSLPSIPATIVVGNPQVFHSGYREPYSIKAIQLLGFPNEQSSIVSGKPALLELAPEELAESLEAGDMVKVRMKSSQAGKYITIDGQVVRKCVMLNVIDIESA
jgi:hypothetical protein